MRKHFCSLIVIIFVITFGVNRVEASSFSCRYKFGTAAAPHSVMLAYNDSDKTFYFYEASGNLNFESTEWKFMDSDKLENLIKYGDPNNPDRKFRFADSYSDDANDIINECPEKAYNDGKGVYVFNNGTAALFVDNRSLKESVNYFYNPTGNGEVFDPNLNTFGYEKSCGSLNLENYWIVNPNGLESYLYAYNLSSYDDKNIKSCVVVQTLKNSSGSIEVYSNVNSWPTTTKYETNIIEFGTEKLYGSYSFGVSLPAVWKFSSSVIDSGEDGVQFAMTLRHSSNGSENQVDLSTCESLIGDDLINELNKYFKLLRIIVPIILIVFGIIDFGGAIFSSSEDAMKKASSKFMKRVIISVIIFLIPTFVNLLLNIANTVWGWGSSNCGIG